MTHKSRDISGRRIFVSSKAQTIPQTTDDWNNFLDNGENKSEKLIFSEEILVHKKFKIKPL